MKTVHGSSLDDPELLHQIVLQVRLKESSLDLFLHTVSSGTKDTWNRGST